MLSLRKMSNLQQNSLPAIKNKGSLKKNILSINKTLNKKSNIKKW